MHEQVVHATGHANVAATHASTLELTTDDWLTPAGDCIVGIEADRSPVSFDRGFVEACRSVDADISLTLRAGEVVDRIKGRGDPKLTFLDGRSLVARTSDYVDDRTVLLGADKAAADLDRDLVSELQRGATVTATLTVRS